MEPRSGLTERTLDAVGHRQAARGQLPGTMQWIAPSEPSHKDARASRRHGCARRTLRTEGSVTVTTIAAGSGPDHRRSNRGHRAVVGPHRGPYGRAAWTKILATPSMTEAAPTP